MRQLALIFRDHREDLQRHWLSLLPGRVGDDYREVLESPVGVKLVRDFIEGLLTVAQAEEYEAPALKRRVIRDARAAAARRCEIGFELSDVLAGVQLLRSALWYLLADVLVMGKLPAVGETIDEMRQVDEYVDRLIRAEIEGYLGGDPGDGAAAN